MTVLPAKRGQRRKICTRGGAVPSTPPRAALGLFHYLPLEVVQFLSHRWGSGDQNYRRAPALRGGRTRQRRVFHGWGHSVVLGIETRGNANCPLPA